MGPVIVPKPRNPMPGETKPRPSQVQVGVRQNGGQLLAVPVQRSAGPRVTVVASFVTGLQVDITRAEALEFAYGLIAMLAD